MARMRGDDRKSNPLYQICTTFFEDVLRDFRLGSKYDPEDSNRVYKKWWTRPGTLDDYSNGHLRDAYTQNLLLGRVLNDLEYLYIATNSPDSVIQKDGEYSKRKETEGSSYSKLFYEIENRGSDIHVVVFGCGPASELWSLLFLLLHRKLYLDINTLRNTAKISKAILVDVAPWGDVIYAIKRSFDNNIQQLFTTLPSPTSTNGCLCSAAALGSSPIKDNQDSTVSEHCIDDICPIIEFVNENAFHNYRSEDPDGLQTSQLSDYSESVSFQKTESFMRWLDRDKLNIIFVYRLTWDVTKQSMAAWFKDLSEILLQQNISAEIFVADAYSTSNVFPELPGWKRHIVIEEGRENMHRNFYFFTQV